MTVDGARFLEGVLSDIQDSNRRSYERKQDAAFKEKSFQYQKTAKERDYKLGRSFGMGDRWLKQWNEAETDSEKDHIRNKWDSEKNTLDEGTRAQVEARFAATPFGKQHERLMRFEAANGKVPINKYAKEPESNITGFLTGEYQIEMYLYNRNRSVYGNEIAVPPPKTKTYVIGGQDIRRVVGDNGSVTGQIVGDELWQQISDNTGISVMQLKATDGVLDESQSILNSTEGSYKVTNTKNYTTGELGYRVSKMEDNGRMLETRAGGKGPDVLQSLPKEVQDFRVALAKNGEDQNGKENRTFSFMEATIDRLLDQGITDVGLLERELSTQLSSLHPGVSFFIKGNNEIDKPEWYKAQFSPSFVKGKDFSIVAVRGIPTPFDNGRGGMKILAYDAKEDIVRDAFGQVVGTYETTRQITMNPPPEVAKSPKEKARGEAAVSLSAKPVSMTALRKKSEAKKKEPSPQEQLKISAQSLIDQLKQFDPSSGGK